MSRIIRYYVSADAPNRKWAVVAIMLGEDGKQYSGKCPTYFPSKREAKRERDKRNEELISVLKPRTVQEDF